MRLEIRTTLLASMDLPLRQEWLQLVAAPGVDLSMAPQWFESSVRSRGAGGRAYVFTVHEAGNLVGVIPYVVGTVRTAGLSARSQESPGSFLVAYHPEVISLIGAEALLAMYLQDAARRCDVVVLPNVDKNGPTASAAGAVVASTGSLCIRCAGHSSPYLTIDGDWDRFLSTKSKKFRYKIRAGPKNLEQTGAVTNRWFSAAEADELLPEILCVEQHSWKAAKGMAIGGSEMEQEYYRLLLPFIASQHALHANILYLDSMPIAYSLGYLSNGCVRQLKTSFDERFAHLSAGSVCQQLAIRKAFEIGAREFDFLGDVMPHKNLWATGVREHASLYLFLRTWRGVLSGGARRIATRVSAMVGHTGDHGSESADAGPTTHDE